MSIDLPAAPAFGAPIELHPTPEVLRFLATRRSTSAVTLTGPAPSQAAKDHATTLARQSDGVKGVSNNLTVQQ